MSVFVEFLALQTMQNLADVSHTVCAHVEGSPKFWGRRAPWNVVWLTPKKTPLPHMCYHDKFGHFKSSNMSVRRVIRRKKWSLASLKVIGTDMDRSATYDFLATLGTGTPVPRCLGPRHNDNTVQHRAKKFCKVT